MDIYCNNKACNYYEGIEDSVTLNFDNPHYKPFLNDTYAGKCKCAQPCMCTLIQRDTKLVDRSVVCGPSGLESWGQSPVIPQCLATNCLWNEYKLCRKPIIFVNKSYITDQWTCKNYSPQIDQHKINLWRFVNSDGTAKGGHIDDDYSEKMDQDRRKFRLYPDGKHREANPRTRKGR
jgi:hypothetical protein